MNSIIKAIHRTSGFNPSSLSPILCVNPYVDAYVTTVDNNGLRQRGNIIDSATATSGQSLATAGTLGSQPIFNGEGWYCELNAQLTTGSNSDYNFLHDGSDFDIWCTVFVCPTISTTYQRGLLTNNGYANNSKGILLRIDSSAGSNTLKFVAGNGSANFITLTANGVIATNATNIVRVSRSGSSAKMFVNGIQVATQTISLSSGVGNAASIMTLAPLASSKANIYLKDIVIFNRALTAGEVTKMNSRTFRSITPTPINVYLRAGDSNSSGRGVNSSIAGDLTGAIPNVWAARFNQNIPLSSTWLGKLQLGINQCLISGGIATQHGAEMRFGKSMGAVAETFILKYGIGSTPLYQNTAIGDWNVASAAFAYNNFTIAAIPQALADLVHVYRRTPIFRGFVWDHGANDAFVGGANVNWVRLGTTVTVTETLHGLLTGYTIPVTVTSDAGAVSLGIYAVTRIDTNTFTIVGVNAGATTGTLSYSAGSTYKANLTNLINGIINYITSTQFNYVTGGAGFTVNKLRIFIPKIRSGGAGFDTDSFNSILAAQIDLSANYLTDNPSMIGKVLDVHTESTEDLGMLDTIHFLTSSYDTKGQREANYFIPFINE